MFFPDLSIESTHHPDVSKKPEKIDTSLWLCKQFQECGMEEYLLPFMISGNFRWMPCHGGSSGIIMIQGSGQRADKYARRMIG